MSIDITKTIEPRSDQQNFDDYAAGPKRVTVAEVKKGSTEQPVEVHLVEFPGRPYKPSKSMRRVLFAAWGGDAAEWVGRQLELYGDPTVKFGGDAVGGIKISRMSHLSEPVTIQLTVTRGKRAPHTVERLTMPENAAAWLRSAESIEQLQKAWQAVQNVGFASIPELIALKDARKAELSGPDS